MGRVIVVDFYPVRQQRVSPDPERVPLALTAAPGAVLMVVPNAAEISFSPKQFREFFAEGLRLADEAEAKGKA